MTQRKVLNVGGGAKRISLPAVYDNWHQIWLDVNPATQPDVLCDARNLRSLPAGMYDSIYCSHTLEHFYVYEVLHVLAGFRHVLKPDGFVFIIVPDLGDLFKEISEKRLNMFDILYESEVGPITVHDVIFGHAGLVAKGNINGGNGWQAHKTGFTRETLSVALREVFPYVYIRTQNREVHAIGSAIAEVPLAT